MRIRVLRRWFVVVIASAIALAVGGVSDGGTASAAVPGVSAWLRQATLAMAGWREVGTVRALARRPDLDIRRRGANLDHLVGTAPAHNPQVSNALVALRAAQTFRDVIVDADGRRPTFDRDAPTWIVANTVVVEPDPVLRAEMREKLQEAAREILRDAACDIAWNALTADERTDAPPVDATRQDTRIQPFSDAVKAYGEREIGAAFGESAKSRVGWTQFSTGVLTKFGDLSSGFDGSDPRLDPALRPLVSRAAVYYARICLAPPS